MDFKTAGGLLIPFLGTSLGAAMVFVLRDNISDKLQKVLTEIATLEKKDQATDRMENYQDRYQIFLGLAALLFLVEALVSERGRRRRQLAGRFS